MYETYFGLNRKAFNLTPDPDFLYLNERTRKGFEEVLYSIERRDGFAVIVGDVGTGKTTLSCALLQKIERQKNIRTVLIQNPMLPEVDMLRAILQDLGVRPDGAWPAEGGDPHVSGAWTRDLTKKELIDRLNTFLAERAREDVFTVLIIDESQNLSVEMLEQLRLLSNLETTKKKLLEIIFLGQLEFDGKLAQLRQLDQRISVRFQTRALSRRDAEGYIRHRLSVAGGGNGIRFGPGALRVIHRYSKGYPRLINMICDRSLREACIERSSIVTGRMVHKAVAGFARSGDMRAVARSRWIRIATGAAALMAVAFIAWVYWPVMRGISGMPAGTRVEALAPAAPRRPDPVTAPAPAARPTPAATRRTVSQPVEYVLQVYSFRTGNKAEESAGQLKDLKFPAFVLHHPGENDDGWYVVYVGPFGDPETARQSASALSAATGATPVLRGRSPR